MDQETTLVQENDIVPAQNLEEVVIPEVLQPVPVSEPVVQQYVPPPPPVYVPPPVVRQQVQRNIPTTGLVVENNDNNKSFMEKYKKYVTKKSITIAFCVLAVFFLILIFQFDADDSTFNYITVFLVIADLFAVNYVFNLQIHTKIINGLKGLKNKFSK